MINRGGLVAKELKVRSFIERNGEVAPFNGFTHDETQAISERLSRSMSRYFTAHPEELKAV